MTTIYRLLLTGAIEKDRGNGHRFYDALSQASKEDLQRAQKSLERYGAYRGTHQARRLLAIRRRLLEVAP